MICLAALATCLAVTVVDGDTLRHADTRLRIWGIDAPEMDTAAGPAARDVMQALIDRRDWQCRVVDTDRYGRPVIRCDALACSLVASGAARDWPRYSGGAYRACREG